MMKYYLMAIMNNNSTAMDNLVYYYEYIEDYDNMIKYYLISIKHNNVDAMYNLGDYYEKINNTPNKIKRYKLLTNANSDSKEIKKIIYELQSDGNISIYMNKINNPNCLKIVICNVCFVNDSKCIYLECQHQVCVDCYPTVIIETKHCPFCRIDL